MTGSDVAPGDRHLRGGQVLVVVAVDERLVLGVLRRPASPAGPGRRPRRARRPGPAAGRAPAAAAVGAVLGPSAVVVVPLVDLQLDDHVLGVVVARPRDRPGPPRRPARRPRRGPARRPGRRPRCPARRRPGRRSRRQRSGSRRRRRPPASASPAATVGGAVRRPCRSDRGGRSGRARGACRRACRRPPPEPRWRPRRCRRSPARRRCRPASCPVRAARARRRGLRGREHLPGPAPKDPGPTAVAASALRSLQRLPPRSPLPLLDGGRARRTNRRPLADRTSRRHRHLSCNRMARNGPYRADPAPKTVPEAGRLPRTTAAGTGLSPVHHLRRSRRVGRTAAAAGREFPR